MYWYKHSELNGKDVCVKQDKASKVEAALNDPVKSLERCDFS